MYIETDQGGQFHLFSNSEIQEVKQDTLLNPLNCLKKFTFQKKFTFFT